MANKKKVNTEKTKATEPLQALGVMLMVFGALTLEMSSKTGEKKDPQQTHKSIFKRLWIERIKNIREAIYNDKKLSASEKQALIGELIQQLA